MRSLGKTECFTPEQFTREWDFIPVNPRTGNEDTAGNFDFHTNLYGIAHVNAMHVGYYL